MSSSMLDSELSSSELRSKLFHSFKSKGVLQSVKTQLRRQLALELHRKATASDSNREEIYASALYQRICNSLFVDHLKRCSYDYTLSVFISEIHTNLAQAIPLFDILELLHIKTNTRLHEVLADTASSGDGKGFLWTFLVNIANAHGNPTTDCSVQTEDIRNTFPNLDRKLFEIEKLQLEKLQNSIKNDTESVEGKILSFQRRYETQKQAELKNEMERFRSLELGNMRLEERDKCQKEFMQMKTEYEKRYDGKLKELERREEELNAKMLRQEKELEKDGYDQRQKILSEMETLNHRDMEMKRNHTSALNSIGIQEEKVKSKEEQLKNKEETMKDIEEHYENKLKHEILRIKLELQEVNIEQVAAMEVKEQELRDEKMKFQAQKDIYLKWKDEAERLQEENQLLNTSLMKSKQTYDILSHKYDDLCEYHKKVNDYEEIKNDNRMLQKDIEILKKNITDSSSEKAQQKREHQKLVRDLLNKINQSSPERENEWKMLQEKEQSISLKYEVLQNKYEVLTKNHAIQVKKNEELRKLYEDILLSQRDLLREVDELKLALYFANQEKGNAQRLQSKRKLPLSIKTNEMIKDLRTSANKSTKGKLDMENVHTQNFDVQFDIKDSNDVLQKLEQEAMELEKSYKQFQERQSQVKMSLPSHIGKRTFGTPGSIDINNSRSLPIDKSSVTDAKQVTTSSQLNEPPKSASGYFSELPKSDSFDLSHLIPSRNSINDNSIGNVPNRGQPPPAELSTNNRFSTTVTESLPSFQVTPFKTGSTSGFSLLVKQDETPRSEIAPLQNVNINISANEFTSNISPSYKQDLLPIKTGSVDHLSGHLQPVSMDGNTSPQSIVDALGRKFYHMNPITRKPITDNALNNQSLTQYTLEDTDDQTTLVKNPTARHNTSNSYDTMHFTALVPRTSDVDSRTSNVDRRTSDIEYRMSDIRNEGIVNNNDRTTNEQVLHEHTRDALTYVPNSPGVDEILKETSLETFGTPVADNMIRNEELQAFKTSDFELKGLQSTRMLSDELQGGFVETSLVLNDTMQNQELTSKDNILEASILINNAPSKRDTVEIDGSNEVVTSKKEEENKGVIKHSTPNEQINVKDNSVQAFSTKSQSSIEKDDESLSESSLTEERTHHSLGAELNVGELHSDGILSAGEVGGDGVVNPMDQYMQMILQKKDDEKTVEITEIRDIQESLHDDVALSEVEEKTENSESSSGFEW